MFTPTQSQKKVIDGVKFPPAGRYVIGVSGGVDSVALLDILASTGKGLDLVVAHFDHGWRDDSHLDAELVKSLSLVFNLPYYKGMAKAARSEAVARQQRYDFLYGLAAQTGAAGIITAHHLNDRLETSIFNTLRGTNRRGRTPAAERPGVYRPLHRLTKDELKEYAESRALPWREDSTNSSLEIQRNFIRHELMPVASHIVPTYHGLMELSGSLNSQIDSWLENYLESYSQYTSGSITFDREKLRLLSHPVIAEVLAYSIRQLEPGLQLSNERLKDLALAVKTGRSGIQKDIAGRLKLLVGYDIVAVALPRSPI